MLQTRHTWTLLHHCSGRESGFAKQYSIAEVFRQLDLLDDDCFDDNDSDRDSDKEIDDVERVSDVDTEDQATMHWQRYLSPKFRV